MSNFKTEFVRRVLEDEGNRYMKNQGFAMTKRLQFHTGDILSARTKEVTADDSMDGKLTINHRAYERFLDIKKRTFNPETGRNTTRALKIHNVFVFGHYFGIANRLATEYTQEAKEAIKKDLNALGNG